MLEMTNKRLIDLLSEYGNGYKVVVRENGESGNREIVTARVELGKICILTEKEDNEATKIQRAKDLCMKIVRETQSDQRFFLPSVDVSINAPLALVQTALCVEYELAKRILEILDEDN